MKTRWAVLGSGGIARRRTIPEGISAASNAELMAVYDVDAAVNKAVAEQYGARCCASEEELIGTDCDVVYIATPVYAHCRQAILAAEAGRHVLCEKPFGLTVAEAEQMASVFREKGLKLGMGLMMRFHAQHQAALKLVQQGALGVMTYGRAQLSCWYPPIPGAWRQDPVTGGGGSLMDLGSHCIDLLEMYLGRVRRVCCVTANRVHAYPSEDTAVVLLEFESGATGTVDALFNVPDAASKNRLELYGAQGGILAEGTIGQGAQGEMRAILEEFSTGYQAQQERDGAGGYAIMPEPVNMYRAEVEAFSRCVQEDLEPPVSGEDGAWSQRIMSACYASARTGGFVEVSQAG